MSIKACTFDVFGTCVDWRGSVEAMLQKALTDKNQGDRLSEVPKMAQTWRDGYSAYNKSVFHGQIKMEDVEPIDTVHRRLLDDLCVTYSLKSVWTKEELDEMNLIWHRLVAWPDTSPGIEALKKKCIVSTLSNGNMRLLVDQAKFADMRWDILLSSELFRSAKPSPKVYLGACKMLNLAPAEVCMVAAHMNDLEGAKKSGFRTAFIERAGEGNGGLDPHAQPYIDFVIGTIAELAEKI